MSLKCKKDSFLKRLNGTCCPVCVCDKCTELNYEICSIGFKPTKQPKLDDECCEIIACISNSDHEDLVLNIDNHHQNKYEDDKFLSSKFIQDFILKFFFKYS